MDQQIHKGVYLLFNLSSTLLLNNYCWLYPLIDKKTISVANMLQHIFVEYGCPDQLHSDNGKEFTAGVVQHLCCAMNIKVIHGSPYHPQTQGQVQSPNKRLKQLRPEEQVNV